MIIIQRRSWTNNIQLLCINITPSEGEFIEIVDIPIYLSSKLITFRINVRISKGPIIWQALALSHILNFLHDIISFIRINTWTWLTITIKVWISLIRIFIVNEEEQLILNNRTSKCHTPLVLLLFLIFWCIASTIRIRIVMPYQALVISKTIQTTVELISTRLSNSINGATRKTTLSYIKRSNVNLNLLNSLHWNRLRSCLTTIWTICSKTEHVIIHSSIYHKWIITVTCTSKWHSPIIWGCQLWIQSGNISNTVSNTRHISNLLWADTLCCTRLCCIYTRTPCYNNLLKFFRIVL